MTQQLPAADPQALLAHRDFVRGIARSLLFDEHAADDVVQQTWLAALGADAPASRGWLGAVARNLAVKRLRGDKRRVAREALVARPEGVPSDEDVRERERLRRDVVDAVLALAEPYRGTILLRYFEELPPRGVAARMGVPVETVRTRTRRAVELLRARLDARHGGDRRAFCAALAAWAGPRHGEGVGAATGGAIVGTKAVAAGVGVAVLGLAAWLLWPRDRAPPAPDGAHRETATAVADGAGPRAPLPAPRRASADPAADTTTTAAPAAAASKSPPLVIGGRVVHTDGKPVAGAEVWIAPSGSRHAKVEIVHTGDDGRFERTMESAAEWDVWLSPLPDPRFTQKDEEPRRVTPPRKDVDFVVTRQPTATLVVSAYDADAGKAIERFACAFPANVSRVPPVQATGKLEALVRLASAAGDTVRVVVAAGGTTGERDVAVRVDERVEIRVDVRPGGAIAGRVVDAAGRPLADALVFFGEEDVGRGDEPFKPFDEKRVKDGVRTGADGRYELRGKGPWITVWHADASPVTLPVARSSEIVLPARGGIRGVLRGADGAPLATTKVFLDRVRETTTDADGRFAFDKVEAGTRGLSLTGGKPKGYVAVRVTAGETTEVDVRPGLPTVKIAWPGRTSFGRFVGLVPLGTSGSLAVGQPTDGAVVAADVTPGRYLLIAEGGAIATAEVSGADATAVVGTGEIVVRAKPKTRVYVVPEGSGYLARLLAGRQAGQGVPADGVQRFTGLVAGRYEVGVERDGVRAVVDVKDAAVEVPID